MSMCRLSRWLYQGNVFVLIFDLVQHEAPLLYIGHWHNYFQELGLAGAGQYSDYLSLISVVWILNLNVFGHIC